ncbi:MAG: hypothetical protein QM504_13620 [Pseudomonadota bacterium]
MSSNKYIPNKLHLLLRDIDRNQVQMNEDFISEDIFMLNDFVISAKNAVVFSFDSYDEALVFNSSNLPDIASLPFPVMWIEMTFRGNTMGILLGKFKNIGIDSEFVHDFATFLLLDNGRFMLTDAGRHYKDRRFNAILNDSPFNSVILSVVQSILTVMNCSNVEAIESKPSNLRKMMKKKGNLPLHSTWTLHIKPGKNSTNQESHGGTHASPRVHLRRGHIRQLSTGNQIWVQPCVVGDKKSGVIHKNYTIDGDNQ